MIHRTGCRSLAIANRVGCGAHRGFLQYARLVPFALGADANHGVFADCDWIWVRLQGGRCRRAGGAALGGCGGAARRRLHHLPAGPQPAGACGLPRRGRARGPYGGMDRRVGAVLLHEQVGSAVDVQIRSHGSKENDGAIKFGPRMQRQRPWLVGTDAFLHWDWKSCNKPAPTPAIPAWL